MSGIPVDPFFVGQFPFRLNLNESTKCTWPFSWFLMITALSIFYAPTSSAIKTRNQIKSGLAQLWIPDFCSEWLHIGNDSSPRNVGISLKRNYSCNFHFLWFLWFFVEIYKIFRHANYGRWGIRELKYDNSISILSSWLSKSRIVFHNPKFCVGLTILTTYPL